MKKVVYITIGYYAFANRRTQHIIMITACWCTL